MNQNEGPDVNDVILINSSEREEAELLYNLTVFSGRLPRPSAAT